MTSIFLRAFERTIGHEGGYVNDPQDQGGETKYGISKRSYPYLEIEKITVEQARQIYWDDFWTPLCLDKIWCGEVACEVFDTAVNTGKFKAVEILQRALNYLGSSLKIDGLIGKDTINAANNADERALLKVLNGVQFAHYLKIVELDPSQKKFAKGWLKRIEV